MHSASTFTSPACIRPDCCFYFDPYRNSTSGPLDSLEKRPYAEDLRDALTRPPPQDKPDLSLSQTHHLHTQRKHRATLTNKNTLSHSKARTQTKHEREEKHSALFVQDIAARAAQRALRAKTPTHANADQGAKALTFLCAWIASLATPR